MTNSTSSLVRQKGPQSCWKELSSVEVDNREGGRGPKLPQEEEHWLRVFLDHGMSKIPTPIGKKLKLARTSPEES